MTDTEFALLGYIVLMLIELAMLGGLRGALALSGKRAPNSFRPAGDDLSPFGQRLTRVHANAYESFPLFGGLLLFAIATGHTDVTEGLALWCLGARVLQAITHLASTSPGAVQVRFGFFVVQVVIWIVWIAGFIRVLS